MQQTLLIHEIQIKNTHLTLGKTMNTLFFSKLAHLFLSPLLHLYASSILKAMLGLSMEIVQQLATNMRQAVPCRPRKRQGSWNQEERGERRLRQVTGNKWEEREKVVTSRFKVWLKPSSHCI